MSTANLNSSRQFDVGCTIEIENTFESLHAHVELDGDVEIEPGDTVKVHGDPIVVPYGEKAVFTRTATVKRGRPAGTGVDQGHGRYRIHGTAGIQLLIGE
jgi:hypothetical protein